MFSTYSEDMIRDKKTVISGCGNIQCSVVQHSIAQRCLVNICGRKKRREYGRLPNITPADQRQEYEFISLSGRYMGADRWPPDSECKKGPRALCFDCISVSILIVIMYNSCVRYQHWEKVSKGYRGSLCIIFYNFMGIAIISEWKV